MADDRDERDTLRTERDAAQARMRRLCCHRRREKGAEMKLVLVVEGVDVLVSVDDRLPLYCVVPPALAGIGNTGPVDIWELRAENGDLLATTVPISEFGFAPETRLLLNRQGPVGLRERC